MRIYHIRDNEYGRSCAETQCGRYLPGADIVSEAAYDSACGGYNGKHPAAIRSGKARYCKACTKAYERNLQRMRR